jgi:hypothetical protein
LPSGGIVARDDFLKTDPVSVEKFVRTTLMGFILTRANRPAALPHHEDPRATAAQPKENRISPRSTRRARRKKNIFAEPLDCVIPAWSAGIKADMDVSGCILANLDAGNPCRARRRSDFHVL